MIHSGPTTPPTNLSLSDVESQFRDAIVSAGLKPPEVIRADGELHRFSTNDRPSDDAGWYVLHSDQIPAGAFGDWRSGCSERFKYDLGRSLSSDEKRIQDTRSRAIRAKRKTDSELRGTQARTRAESIWQKADTDATSHAYLTEKGVGAYGVRVHNGKLVIPLRIGNILHSLQFISTDGEKRFLTGGRKKGCYHLLGTPGEVLCIAEGYATAAAIHESTGHSVAVAFDCGNLKPIAEALCDIYPEAEFIICADNDENSSGNPGLTKAREAATSIDAHLAIPVFLQSQGTDFNDLARSEGREAVIGVIDEARNWPEPEPITPFLERELYPVDALPPVIEAAVREVQKFVQAPMAMVATSALSALSLSLQGYFDVERTQSLSGPISLYTLTIAESGERKSTLDNYFTRSILDYESEMRELLKDDVRRYWIKFDSWTAKRKGLLQKITELTKTDKLTDGFDRKLEDLEYEKPEPVLVPHLVLGDETPEHLAMVLRNKWPAAGIVSSEAGLVLGSHGMGQESIMRNLSQLNVLWDGGELHYGRVTRESVVLRDARLTVALQIQPQTFQEFLSKNGTLARGNGFLARFLLACPESTQGFRPITDPPKDWPALNAFRRRISEILSVKLPVQEEGGVAPRLIKLDPHASNAWRTFHDVVEEQLRPGGELSEVKDAASKVADNVARVAAIFQMFADGSATHIDDENMEAAVRIVYWHLTESRRFLQEHSLPDDLRRAALLDVWLIRHCKRESKLSVPKGWVRQRGPNSIRKTSVLDAALQELVNLNRIKLDQSGRTQVIRLNPALVRS